MEGEGARHDRVYGRRGGRRLRPRRRALIAERLPALEVALPEGGTMLAPERLFAAAPSALWAEIGFGMGEHLAALARAHPQIGFIGCEPYRDGVARLLSRIDEEGLANIRIYPGDGLALLAALPEASLARLYVLHPDPWPKKRHHKRRLIRPQTAPLIARVLADGARLHLATDDGGYLRWMLRTLAFDPALRWCAECALDWRRRPEGELETRYEAKARRAGRAPVYLVFERRPRGARRAGAPEEA